MVSLEVGFDVDIRVPTFLQLNKAFYVARSCQPNPLLSSLEKSACMAPMLVLYQGSFTQVSQRFYGIDTVISQEILPVLAT